MDSQVPNKVVNEWLISSGYFKDITLIKPETKYNNSRFDFYIEYSGVKAFIEVKGVTLEENGIVSFPDAPTLRGIKHLEELVDCYKEGYKAFVIFVIQMEEVDYFTVNTTIHPEFGFALKNAIENGVVAISLDSIVTINSISPRKLVEIRL